MPCEQPALVQGEDSVKEMKAGKDNHGLRGERNGFGVKSGVTGKGVG